MLISHSFIPPVRAKQSKNKTVWIERYCTDALTKFKAMYVQFLCYEMSKFLKIYIFTSPELPDMYNCTCRLKN